MTTRDMIRMPDGADIDFVRCLGAGGQGEVWLVEVEGETHAAKIYFENNETEAQRGIIEDLVRRGNASPHFLWPTALIVDSDEPHDGGFGYLMPLREARFRGLGEIVGKRVGIGFEALLQAALHLADAFQGLHTQGYAYRDINLNNVFIDPSNGDIAICDNDNVGIDVAMNAGVLGTSGFMAPEIERGEARPSAATDRHSLAVLLFQLLVQHHPLEGALEQRIRCMDLPARRHLYGQKPVYIFDPADTSNRPTAEQVNPTLYRGIYPEVLWKLFERAFTEGLHDPGKRVGETGWKRVLRATRDLLVRCACGARRFVDPTAARACWKCQRAGGADLVLRFGQGVGQQAVVAAAVGRTLDGGHMQLGVQGESLKFGTFVQRPDNANIVSLRNDSTEPWRRQLAGATTEEEVAPGRHVDCLPGTRIHFGKVVATVAGA
jgi:DNA-binding helix-hairpin-helix protein with protein kinase domain